MKPVLQALVLAERIYTDHHSGKKIIAGTFNRVRIGKIKTQERKLPDGSKRQLVPGGTDIGCPSVYLSLTDVVDGTELTLQFVNVTKNQILLESGFKINSKDRLATIEIVAPLPPLAHVAGEAGVFSLDVVWNGEILGSHRIRVEEIQVTGDEKQ